MTASRTRILVEIALTIALSAVLHFVKVWQMPAGGSVSLEMLPIFVLALRRGIGPGLIAGALFGIVDYFLEPFVVHWIQFFLDYPIAFAAVGLAGLWTPLWRGAIDKGRATAAVAWVVPAAVVTGALGRYIAHFLSGVVFFATVAGGGPLPNGTSAFATGHALQLAMVYSAVYNLYVPISAIACLILAVILVPTLEKVVPVEKAA
jgi:thiamine transporter